MMDKMKIFGVAAVALVSSAVYAGGPQVVLQPACVVDFAPFAYLGIAGGVAFSDWNSFIFNGANNFFGVTPFVGDVDTSGFAYGAKFGYQATENFGVEVGGYVLPESDQHISTAITYANGSVTNFLLDGTVKSWFAYAAGTVRAALPFQPNAHIFTKFGGVYRSLDHDGNLYNNVGGGGYWTVIMGAGFDVDLSPYNNWPISLGLEYLLIPGSSDSWFDPSYTNQNSSISSNNINENAAPAAHLVVGSVSLRLSI